MTEDCKPPAAKLERSNVSQSLACASCSPEDPYSLVNSCSAEAIVAAFLGVERAPTYTEIWTLAESCRRD